MQSVKYLFSNLKEDLATPMLHNLHQNKIIKELINLNKNKGLADRNLIKKYKSLKELHHLIENNKVLNYVIAGDNTNLVLLKDSIIAELNFEEFKFKLMDFFILIWKYVQK